MQIQSKDTIQQEVLNNSDVPLIILEHATGLGKSFSALKLINKHSPKRVLLLVAEVAHIANWLIEFDKFKELYEIDLLKNIELDIKCYASIHKYRDTTWDMVILDECHRLSELRLQHLSSITATKYIALSATLKEEKLQNIKTALGSIESYHSKISLQQAIQYEVLPEPKIFLIPLTLNNIFPNQEIVVTRGRDRKKRVTIETTFEKRFLYLNDKKKYPELELRISCTQQEKYDYLTSNMAYWERQYFLTGTPYMKNIWLQTGSERKRFLGESKTAITKRLLRIIRNSRYICFCASIDQANTFSDTRSIHSKNSEETNNKILEYFQSKEINSIFAVSKLTEGVNLIDIEVGIIVQLDGTERPFTQKVGRVLRSDDPVQYIFYYKDTQDEVYLNRILEGLDKSYVKVINDLNEIGMKDGGNKN